MEQIVAWAGVFLSGIGAGLFAIVLLLPLSPGRSLRLCSAVGPAFSGGLSAFMGLPWWLIVAFIFGTTAVVELLDEWRARRSPLPTTDSPLTR